VSLTNEERWHVVFHEWTFATSPEEVARGKAIYETKVVDVAGSALTCAACHGQRLEGGVGPSLVGIGSRIPPTKIERIAQRGKGKNKPVSMPPGLATPEEARLLARWLAAGPKLAVDAPETGQAK